jgi:hypothetical protein
VDSLLHYDAIGSLGDLRDTGTVEQSRRVTVCAHSQIGQKPPDLRLIHLSWMTFLVKIDVALVPVQVGFFCTSAIVADPNLTDNFLQKSELLT